MRCLKLHKNSIDLWSKRHKCTSRKKKLLMLQLQLLLPLTIQKSWIIVQAVSSPEIALQELNSLKKVLHTMVQNELFSSQLKRFLTPLQGSIYSKLRAIKVSKLIPEMIPTAKGMTSIQSSRRWWLLWLRSGSRVTSPTNNNEWKNYG